MEFKLKALTDIWTGGVNPKQCDKLHLTGIKGSIRWWYEALLRGLGCYACDPTGDSKCTMDLKKFNINKGKPLDQRLEASGVCKACGLFGCTGWSGKFILRVKDNNGQSITHQIKKDNNNEFVIELAEIKPFSALEKKLINFAFKLIVEYGAIGGRTTLKPSEIDNKNTKLHHLDFGIMDYQDGFTISSQAPLFFLKNINNIENKNDPTWPDLNYFWFIKGAFIDRITHNKIVKRDPINPKNYLPSATNTDRWLGGRISHQKIPAESKKIFSFHSSPANRCWGYTQKDQDMYDRLIKDLENCGLKGIKSGKEIIKNGF